VFEQGTYLVIAGTLASGTAYRFGPDARLLLSGYVGLGAQRVINGQILAPDDQPILTGQSGVTTVVSGGHENLYTINNQPYIPAGWFPAYSGTSPQLVAYLASAQSGTTYVPIKLNEQNVLTRRYPATFANGANDNTGPFPVNIVSVDGPTGSYTFSGVAPADGIANLDGLEMEFIFLPNQQLTIRHLADSSVANRIMTPTGADIVLSAPGTGFHYARLRYIYDPTRPNGEPSLAYWLLVDYE
jgi:hypothetical protein